MMALLFSFTQAKVGNCLTINLCHGLCRTTSVLYSITLLINNLNTNNKAIEPQHNYTVSKELNQTTSWGQASTVNASGHEKGNYQVEKIPQ